jgi:hypothetical protein
MAEPAGGGVPSYLQARRARGPRAAAGGRAAAAAARGVGGRRRARPCGLPAGRRRLRADRPHAGGPPGFVPASWPATTDLQPDPHSTPHPRLRSPTCPTSRRRPTRRRRTSWARPWPQRTDRGPRRPPPGWLPHAALRAPTRGLSRRRRARPAASPSSSPFRLPSSAAAAPPLAGSGALSPGGSSPSRAPRPGASLVHTGAACPPRLSAPRPVPGARRDARLPEKAAATLHPLPCTRGWRKHQCNPSPQTNDAFHGGTGGYKGVRVCTGAPAQCAQRCIDGRTQGRRQAGGPAGPCGRRRPARPRGPGRARAARSSAVGWGDTYEGCKRSTQHGRALDSRRSIKRRTRCRNRTSAARWGWQT